MASPKDHYDNLLAERYSWMFGDFDARVTGERERLQSLGIAPMDGGRGADLGCGAGVHAIALAGLGYQVEAIDFSETLLDELAERRGDLPVTPILGDMLDAARLVDGPVDVVLCMGDTLPHLQSLGEVERLFAGCAELLKPGGRLVLGFRDLSREAEGLDRFISVRETEHRVMTCFLEYEEEHVKVHDLFHEWQDGHWQLHKSMYRKLRLGPDRAAEMLAAAGFEMAARDETRGMVHLVAVRRQD
ncbi:MAG: methyltransferase domain-containing protein [Rhodospirillales bacterium]|jgi:SAM-dependent methyltransferase|nr:SAM-dependent methyltransferase [Rhodospirillaceae bacterium]MDP6427805.1 methyltransferase domain-containing protein [Rhodospirillales bacterium]MDP6644561.1 methyltransferase domain-containing protein [Rhodospirillales bacterium]MDP6840305.1 methyltransferase domain-containing protein [Rhodospirillales bacterium]